MASVDRFNNAAVTLSERTAVVVSGRTATSAATGAHLYYLRGYDSGTAGYVYWGPYSSPIGNLSPASSQTTPNYTGVLSNPHVWFVR